MKPWHAPALLRRRADDSELEGAREGFGRFSRSNAGSYHERLAATRLRRVLSMLVGLGVAVVALVAAAAMAG